MKTFLPSPKLDQRLLTIGQASKYLGVSIDSLRRWDKAGRLTSVRLDGKNRFFSLSDLERIKTENQKLKVSDVAMRFGVSASTVRRYEKKGLINPERNPRGERLYSENDLGRIFTPEKPEKQSQVTTFMVILLVITTSLSTLYMSEVANRSRNKIIAEKERVLGIQDEAGSYLARISSFLTDPLKRSIEQYRIVFTQIEKQTKETQVTIKERETIPVSLRPALELNENGTLSGLVVTAANLAGNSVTGGVGGVIKDASIVTADISDSAITGAKIVNDGIKNEDIAPGAVNSNKIEDDSLTSADLSSTLTFSDGDLLDLSSIDHSSTSKMGLILPNVSSATPSSPTAGEGYVAWDTSGNQMLVYDGSSWAPVGGSISLYTGASGTSTASSASGLELISSDKLSLIRGCSDTQVLKWNNTAKTWGCADDSGAAGAGISTIKENNVSAVTSATALDFLGADFIVTNAGGGEGDVAIDYTNSKIVRSNQNETITGSWTITATDLSCTNCIGPTEVSDLTLGTDTAGNYVATLTSGSGISATATGEGSTPTISLAALTSDWTQSGAFDIVLANALSEIKIKESAGDTYYGILDVGDLGSADAIYTFSGTSGTVLTSVNASTTLSTWDQDSSNDLTTSNYSTTLDSVYVNVGESPAAGDISGSFSGGFTVGANTVALTTDTTGNYVAGATSNSGLTMTGTEGGTLGILLPAAADALSLTTSSGSGLELLSGGVALLQGCSDSQILKWNEATDVWYCAADATGGGGSLTVRETDTSPSVATVSTLEFGPTGDSTADFVVSDQTGGVARVVLGSNVGHINATESVSGAWTFSNLTISDTTISLSSGSTALDLTGASDTILDIKNSDTGVAKLRVDSLTNGGAGCDTIDTTADGTLICGTDAGGAGGGIATVKEGGTNIVTSATSINFAAADFIVTDETGGQAGIAVDYTNSKIVRSNQAETITGGWSFTTGTTTVTTADINGGNIDGTTIGTTTAADGTFTGATITTSALAVNSDSITSDGATLTINAGGSVDVQDALTADSLTIDAGNAAVSAGTLDVAKTLASTTADNILQITLTNGTSSGNQYVGYLDNAASTGTTEAILGIDNSDTDTAVTAGIQFINGGGGFTSGIDMAGLTIVNVGNTGTDFDSSGGLTLASSLTLSNNTITCTGCVDATDLAADSVDDSELVGTLSYSGALTISTSPLAVNSDSITSDGNLTIDATSSVILGGGGNTFTFSETAGPTYAGTARPHRQAVIAPEYPGAVLTADGASNTGTMTSDFCSNTVGGVPNTNTGVCNTSSDIHNYYNWTTSQGTAQDYDIWIRYRLPDNFSGWDTNPIQVYGKRTDTTNNAVQAYVYDTAGALNNAGGTQVAGANWTQTAVTLSGGTWTAGSYMSIRIAMTADTGGDSVQAGEINLNYLSTN